MLLVQDCVYFIPRHRSLQGDLLCVRWWCAGCTDHVYKKGLISVARATITVNRSSDRCYWGSGMVY